MLKWSIANKREEKGEGGEGGGEQQQRRRSTAGICTMRERSAGKATKRRRSSATRRSGASRRSGVDRLDVADKENQYTSTPIKGSDDASPQDAFRDVSNLTPKDNSNRRRRRRTTSAAFTTIASAKKCKSISRQLYSPKKKKQCVESHSQDFVISPDSSRFGNNYFRHFEAVDSHIEGLTSKDFNDLCRNAVFEDEDDVAEEKPTKRTSYAPTLPKLALEYSPCALMKGADPMQILTIQNKLTDLCPPSKKAKIDHVNDFLQQISCFTSPEEEEESKMIRFATQEDPKLSPLVKRFVDLRFNRLASIKDSSNCLNNSSFINNLSLDKIVDAILDSSNDSSNNNNNNYNNHSNSERECERAQERDNELNETQEENLINTEQEEKQNYYSDRNSTDSGFRSSSVQSHESDANFACKCSGPTKEEMTMINLDGTYNERCVDEDVNGRKRPLPSSPSEEEVQVKRPLLDGNCALRRQKGIRRRRLEDNMKTPQTTITSEMTDANDHSFDSEDSDDLKHETFVVDVAPKVACSTPNARTAEDRGTIDLQVDASNEELLINIFSCSDLRRANGQPINAYVKVAVSERTGEGRRRRKGTLQRTAVQAESSGPVFEHVFRVPVQKADLQKVLHVEVWHRDRATRRSEFLGCMSFVIKNAIKKNISGSYQLLPQSSSRCNQLSKMCESQSSVEDVVGGGGLFEDMEGETKKTPCKVSLLQQQKDADENLFLRYLELDPTEGPEAAPAAAQRKATGNKTNGRTPFTTTKVLRRAPKSGFGFSVVWTHPPRIERVEKGLPADKAGILPGDYLIFVDKHNVVMMPEIDILNLIRSFGNLLTLETFRRNASRNGSVPSVRRLMNFPETENSSPGFTAAPASLVTAQRRPSTVCSTNTTSVEYNRKKLHLPQVTFSSEKPTSSAEEIRRKSMYQIITREQQYATSLQFSLARYVSALAERKDLIGANDHRILFQNADELLRITEDVLDILVQEDGDYQTHLLLRTYHMKLNEMTGAYKRYCSGIQKADCVLANLLKNQEFVRFTQVPAIPRRRPDITVFVHKPLEHYREILKLFNVLLGQTKSHHVEYRAINHIVHELQVNYREMTSEAGLMEPMGEGRPLLSVQDLENRLVFTKCKPFVLSKPGRQWIFGGDLSRVEGRTVRQYWALLFSDILLFAKVSRDRVLFILEDPLPLSQITDFLFNVRKKANEFRIVLEPGGAKNATSPTVHCGPDLSRTPRKNPGRRCIILRTPTVELKAVWQNLLQRQIFHINAGMEGSSYSSPLESPDAPITSSVVTLQSADSLSLRRQAPRNVNYSETEQKKQLDELIEHKCKQLEKSSSSSKSNAIHLEQWMKGQFGGDGAPAEEPVEDDDDDFELWTEERVRKRSEELRLLLNNSSSSTQQQQHANTNGNANAEDVYDVDAAMRRCCESRCEDIAVYSDHEELSPSRSTNTTESQVTVRSSPLVPETVNVCRQCHRTCVQSPTMNGDRRRQDSNCKNNNCVVELQEEEEDWRPLVLMGLNAVNPTACLVKLDPFAAPPPQISVLPPTPELQMSITHSEFIPEDANCNCKPQIGELILNKDYDNSPDDSPLIDEQPYHSLNSSNLTLKRYGTVSSLERVASDEQEDYNPRENSSDEESDYEVEEDEDEDDIGIDNEAFNNSSIMSWTARAGTFVAEKMAFFEKYLKNEITVNGDDGQEEETSGATSGEEIWGTPTSGGDLDDPLSSNCGDPRNSPNGEESLSSNEDTELMMDELLMTPPVTSSSIRGLLPRRTLEPLMEEEYSDTYTSSSSSTASSASNDSTPTKSSMSPKKGNGTGDAADECSAAAEPPAAQTNSAGSDTPRTTASYASMTRTSSSLGRMLTTTIATATTTTTTIATRNANSIITATTISSIHRSESYRRIIEAEDDHVGFFTRFRNRPSMRFVNIERIPPTRGVKFLEFFNVRRERKIYETFPGGKHLIKVFSKEGDYSDEVPTAFPEKPESLRRLKERQLDRRFWKQLSKRRGNKPIQLSA